MSSLQSQGTEFSIIVPVFNSQKTLEPLYERIVATMEKLQVTFEIIFVDDSSIDGSWGLLATLSEKDNRVVALQLMRNFGQAGATMCGLRRAKGEFLVTIDDDLQNPPEEIKTLVETICGAQNLDVVFGVPSGKKHSLVRRMGSYVLNRVNSKIFSQYDPNLQLTSFRVMRRSVVNILLEVRTPNPAPGPLLCTITPRIGNVIVRHEPRQVGKSGYSFAKLFRLTIDKTLTFSTLPLRLLALVGMLGIIFSLVLGVIYITGFFLGIITVPGWTTLVLILIFLSGFNFFAFGIVGEYLLRIMQAVHGMPQYLVRQHKPVHQQNGKRNKDGY